MNHGKEKEKLPDKSLGQLVIQGKVFPFRQLAQIVKAPDGIGKNKLNSKFMKLRETNIQNYQ